MHVQEDRAAGPDAASCLAPLYPEAFESAGPASVSVVLASAREEVQSAWIAMLACERGIALRGAPLVDAAGLVACIALGTPQVVLLDKLLFDGLDGEALRRLGSLDRQTRVLLVSDEIGRDLAAEVLRHGFHGLLQHPCRPDIGLKAIRAVAAGELWLSRAALAKAVIALLGVPGVSGSTRPLDARVVPTSVKALTPREQQVVALLRRGCINKEIAHELGIVEDTVKKHLQSVFAKLGVHRRALVALPFNAYPRLHALPPAHAAERSRGQACGRFPPGAVPRLRDASI